MKRAIAGLGGMSLLALTQPALAAEVEITSTGPVIELTVSDTAQAKPDAAVLSAGVTTRAMTANDAARQNARQMDAIIAKLKQMGVAAADIQTSNFSLSPQYAFHNDGQPAKFIGFDVNNNVTVKVRDIAKIGPTLDALIAAGANNFSGPNFILENDAAAKAAARRSAFASAEARARELAGYAGYKVVKLLELSETYQTFGGAYPPPPMPMAIAVSAVSRSDTTPIQPGLVGTTAQLIVKYELGR